LLEKGSSVVPSFDSVCQEKEMTMKPQDKEHGEGNYKASREYNKATKDFVESGKVDEAAEKAKPRSEQEARELKDAEEAAKSRAKG
jgi:hypothetical protein